MARIGVDEVGKGDYFGFLVAAAVYADDAMEKKLAALGVKDSKRLSDAAVKALAPKIRKLCPHDIVRISPEKYNQLYGKFQSLNPLLAWAHARAIENILGKVSCDTVIIDKFGDDRLVTDMLFEKGKKVKLIQRINAEQDIAVAAASVIARDSFLSTLRGLGREMGIVLPKGATHVEDAAKRVVEMHGADGLKFVAKLHFKITKRILGKQ